MKLASQCKAQVQFLAEWQMMRLTYMYQGSEFGHWIVQGGKDTFAFRQAPMWELLESEVHSPSTSVRQWKTCSTRGH